MQLKISFIISVGILSSHMICDADAPNNTNQNSSRQVQNNFNDAPYTNAVEHFTDDEIRRVQRTWILATQDYPLEFGEDVLWSLIDRRPMYGDLFTEFINNQRGILSPEEAFEKQCMTIIDTMTTVVNSLSHVNEVEDLLSRLGKYHKRIGVEKDNFVDFKEAVLHVLHRNLCRQVGEEDRRAWVKVLDVMLKYFFKGYEL